MRKGIKILLVSAAFFSEGCKKELKSVDYMHFVQSKENGLRKTISVDGWDYMIQYKPYDYIIANEHVAGNTGFDAGKRLAMLKGTAWFNVSVKRTDGKISPMRFNLSDRSDYDKRLDYFLNGAMKDFKLIYDKKDTLYPMSYEFENNYNLTPQETMVIAFSLPKGEEMPAKDMQISYNDRVFKNGIIKAVFSEKDLNNIPNIIH